MKSPNQLWLLAALLAGCGAPHGQPAREAATPAPREILTFDSLYAANCAGCHGRDGRDGAAIALADPVYLEIADQTAIRKAIGSGVPGTAMPAFAESAGGLLTDDQVNAIAGGIRSRWARPGVLAGATRPSYVAKSAGDPERGRSAYGIYCASCHGMDGNGGDKGSAITNDSFLALVSDQGLRTIVIAGRPELGAPDWRGNVAGHPMSDQEITDVVAWLVSRRSQTPGQPYSATNRMQR